MEEGITVIYVCILQPIGSIAEWFKALAVKDSGVIYEDPYVQVGCSLRGELLGSL